MPELKHVTWFVHGACHEHYETPTPKLLREVTELVWFYLHGSQVLDGSCSDFECTLALDAARVFLKD